MFFFLACSNLVIMMISIFNTTPNIILAELSYWEDIDTNPNQKIWSATGGDVNIHDKVFGCGAGSVLNNGYIPLGINNNPDSTFSGPIMAGFLRKYTIFQHFRFHFLFKIHL